MMREVSHVCIMSMKSTYTPLNPLLHRKTGVCRSIPIFVMFAPKHSLWVLIKAVLMCTQSLCFEQNLFSANLKISVYSMGMFS